ncbi:hypothetical protein C1645_743512, partial [Glomus cerebriforme]
KHLDISYERLEGSLKLEGFTNLETFDRGDGIQLTRLDISPAKKLKSVYCADSSGDDFSEKKSKKITELIVGDLPKLELLICQGNELTSLDLRGCPKLQVLDCSKNKKTVNNRVMFTLTNLDISNCSQLRELNCSSNRLTDFEDLNLSQKTQLEKLDISFNRLFGNLTDFSHLVNLKELSISGNRFRGSLESLKNMNKLTILNIDFTDIGRGLEYLPESLLRISCLSADEFTRQMMRNNPDSWCNPDNYGVGIKKIEEIMEPYSEMRVKQSRIKTLESQLNEEKEKYSQLQKGYSFYKNFFDSHFKSKKTELTELKSKLNKEEQEWLDIYCEASQETEQIPFVKKQLKRAKENLKEKLSEEELKSILEKHTEINELESQLNSLQVQEQDFIQENQIEISPK